MTGPQDAGEHLDCSEVVSRVYFFLDNELEQGDVSMIEQHILECGPCTERYRIERTVRSLVARSCVEKAPETLRDRVLLGIREVRVQYGDPDYGDSNYGDSNYGDPGAETANG